MENAEVIQKLIFFNSEITLLIIFTSENNTFLKYACYFINIFLYFIILYMINRTNV